MDAESVAWLEQFLAAFKGTVVAITHDRYFLENSCSWILELDKGEGIPWEGNYSAWLEKKRQKLETEKRQTDRYQKMIANELQWVKSNSKGRQEKSKARILNYENLLAQSKDSISTGSIFIPPGPRLGELVIRADHISKSFEDRKIIDDLSFDIPPGAIVGVIGEEIRPLSFLEFKFYFFFRSEWCREEYSRKND